jgi:hypothetical protein
MYVKIRVIAGARKASYHKVEVIDLTMLLLTREF